MSADIKKPFEDKLKHKGNSTYEKNIYQIIYLNRRNLK